MTRLATMDLGDVRRHHLSVVLERLVQEGPRSRACLAQVTGLTKGTVSQLVGDLLRRGLVEEMASSRAGRVGRPATDVAASGGHVGGLGLVIEVDHVAATIVDLTGETRAFRRRKGDNRGVRTSTAVDRIATVVRAVREDARRLGIHLVGGALAVPGLVDPSRKSLLVAPNLRWSDDELTNALESLGLPDELHMVIDNDANLAALAEMRMGAGRDHSSFVYVSGGIGIGAGVVLDGRLVRGAHGFAGEIGHVVVDPAGRPCACGSRGCLETIAGSGRTSSLEEKAHALSAALRNVIHIIDPQAVLLGGAFAPLGDEFAAAVRDRLHATTLTTRWPCEVLPANLGDDAALLGAASVALDRIIDNPTIVPELTASRAS